ncbi:MAG: class I SAM-dependent methyltransferase [Spirochaetia bacterium]|nr:class I SAM-dependent methyltransferase [Spirochaetia bacterium]
MEILDHNREAWNKQVEDGNIWTKPVNSQQIEEARKGKWSVVLTPTKPVPSDWFPKLDGKKILCLASGGGQQGPVLAAATGAEVTVLDNSPYQLERDKMVAARERLSIAIEQGDMRDLSRFADDSFDLIFHPVSNCFIDDVNKVWKECYRVLKKGGPLLAGFGNPITYIFDMHEWDVNQNLTVRHRIPYSDLEHLPKEQLELRIANKETLEFGHSLQDQIGGQIDVGFTIKGFYEDSSGGDLLDSYINSFIATRAIKE